MRTNTALLRRSRPTLRIALAIVLVAATSACSSDSKGDNDSDGEGDDNTADATVTYETLREFTGTVCPVDLDGAIEDAGFVLTSSATGSVAPTEVMPASTDVESGNGTIDVPERPAGVEVNCANTLAEGPDVKLLLYAAEGPGAAALLLPALSAAAEIPSAGIAEVADDIAGTERGAPIPLPEHENVVTFATTVIEGASSSAMLLTATGGLDQAGLDKIAAALDDALG